MKIRLRNDKFGITEEFSNMDLEFIRRSYEEYADKDMSKDDYVELSKKITFAKYEGSRFSEAKWEVSVEE
jgi:hypothetical protein